MIEEDSFKVLKDGILGNVKTNQILILSSEQKIKYFQQAAEWTPSFILEHFEEAILILEQGLSENSKQVRIISLNLGLNILQCCKTVHILSNFFNRICHKVTNFFSSSLEDLVDLDQRQVVDVNTGFSLVKNQRECLQFFSTSFRIVENLPGFPQISLLPFHSLLAEIFDVAKNGLQTLSRIKALNFNSNQILQSEAENLFKESKEILQRLFILIDNFTTNFETALNGKTEVDTITMITLKLLGVAEVMELDSKFWQSAWKRIKELIIKYNVPLQSHSDTTNIMRSIIYKSDLQLDIAIKLLYQNQSDLEIVKMITFEFKKLRFLLEILSPTWERTTKAVISLTKNMLDFIIKMGQNFHTLIPVSSNEIKYDIEKFGIPKIRQLTRVLFLSSSDQEKADIIHKLQEDTSETYALGRIILFLEILQVEGKFSFFVGKELVQLEWLMTSIEHSYVAFFYLPLFERLVIGLSTLILKTFLYYPDSILLVNLEKALIKHLLNPHLLSYQIISCIWVYIFKNAEEDLAKRYLHLFCEMLNSFNYKPNLFDSPEKHVLELLNKLFPYLSDSNKNFLWKTLFPSNFETFSEASCLWLVELPLASFPSSNQKSLFPLVSKCIGLCDKWILKAIIPIIQLRFSIQTIYSIFRHATLLEQVPFAQKQRVIEIIIQLLLNNQLYTEQLLVRTLLKLAGVLMSLFDSTKLLSLLTALSALPASCPFTKIDISNLLSQSSQVKPALSLKDEIFSKYCVIWHTLFGDTNWAVVNETCKNFRLFCQVGSFANINNLVPLEQIPFVSAFLKNFSYGSSGIDPNFNSSSQNFLEKEKELNHYCKRRKLNSGKETERVKRGIRLLKEGINHLTPIPQQLSPNEISTLREELKIIQNHLLKINNAFQMLSQKQITNSQIIND